MIYFIRLQVATFPHSFFFVNLFRASQSQQFAFTKSGTCKEREISSKSKIQKLNCLEKEEKNILQQVGDHDHNNKLKNKTRIQTHSDEVEQDEDKHIISQFICSKHIKIRDKKMSKKRFQDGWESESCWIVEQNLFLSYVFLPFLLFHSLTAIFLSPYFFFVEIFNSFVCSAVSSLKTSRLQCLVGMSEIHVYQKIIFSVPYLCVRCASCEGPKRRRRSDEKMRILPHPFSVFRPRRFLSFKFFCSEVSFDNLIKKKPISECCGF